MILESLIASYAEHDSIALFRLKVIFNKKGSVKLRKQIIVIMTDK
jgi:hypothetical protein